MAKKKVQCNFCMRNGNTVKHIIQGIGCFICRDCVEFCVKIFEQNELNDKYNKEQEYGKAANKGLGGGTPSESRGKTIYIQQVTSRAEDRKSREETFTEVVVPIRKPGHK